ncbi:hypothetical protein ACFU7Y_23245 [Kitasatospora sp. NPDC057542]|uniref:hypothetical protein n=1 Tax=Kitasatospora sp. NPDC057542 TaxID=3346162 RepID=UPI003676D127
MVAPHRPDTERLSKATAAPRQGEIQLLVKKEELEFLAYRAADFAEVEDRMFGRLLLRAFADGGEPKIGSYCKLDTYPRTVAS